MINGSEVEVDISVYKEVQEVGLPRVKLFDLRRRQPNGKKVKLGFVRSQNELTSSEELDRQVSKDDLEQIRQEVNASKRKLNRDYLNHLKQTGAIPESRLLTYSS